MDKYIMADALRKIAGEANVRIDELMANHTTFRLGGPADIMVIPPDTRSLIDALNFCRQQGAPVFVMGNGSNLIVRDKGIRGVVIKIYDNMNTCTVKGDIIEAEAGILLSKLSALALENSLAGLEFASGIPGTLGGAVVMNAGAYDGEMKDVIVSTQYIDQIGNIVEIYGEEHRFKHRTSILQINNGVVIKCVLRLKKGNYQDIKAVMDDLKMRRKDKQPLEMPSAGSVFKRPEGYFAAKLVDDCGLRGCRIGGAEVSVKHCGFIVNAGGAKAKDVTDLISHIKSSVMEKFNVELNTEVKIIGEE